MLSIYLIYLFWVFRNVDNVDETKGGKEFYHSFIVSPFQITALYGGGL